MTARPFASTIVAYAQAGWLCILPVPREKKHPPPVGFTGADGRDTDPLQLVEWVESHGDYSIALRMPDGVIGIDVDHYDKGSVSKRGGDSLAEFEQRWGPLPPTWISTARALPSGIRFYRVPPGRYATKLGDSIEIIQRHHRYAVVAPSPHTEIGREYRWLPPDGDPRFYLEGGVPKPDELPELPAAWVAGLAEGATEAGPAAADISSGQMLLTQLMADDRPACADVTSAAMTAVTEMTKADSGARHDTATARVHHLVQLGAKGHPGVGTALHDLAERWEQLTSGEDRAAEFERMLLTSARKAVTVVGVRQVDRDPCLMTHGMEWSAPAPADDRPDAGEPVTEPEPARWWSVREVIGAHAFDPRAELDQTLAQAVLERTYPALRYAYDAGSWLLRGPDRWEPRGDLAGWAVAEVASLAPLGDPEAEKGTDERRRADRRKKLMGTAGANAIASKARALVASGGHPCALNLADLDADPELLWAGGQAWHLRGSADAPTLAGFDPSTPHLHAAAVAPDPNRPTPRWDAFTAAVWPDPDVRAWALRVLSIALTGYPDAALPILIGPTRRGKSQVVTLLMSLLGTYAHAADPRLLASGDNSHASIVYALKGRRLSFIDEGPREGRLATERLKQLTGGTELTGNRMRENPVTFTPTHTLVLTANEEPALTDAAVRARVRLIPCDADPDEVRHTRAAIGHTRAAAWRTEAPGVLAAMMREAARWLADAASASTAAAPAVIRYLAEALAAEQDPVRTWVEAETVPDEHGTKSRELYQAFVRSGRDSNLHHSRIPTETNWGRTLNDLGYPVMKRADANYRGLRLRAPGGWSPLLPAQPSADSHSPYNSRASYGGSSANTDTADKPAQPMEGSVEADGDLTAEPSIPCFRRSEPVLQTPNGGLEGLDSLTTPKNKIHKKKYIPVIGRRPPTHQSEAHQTASDLRKQGVGGPSISTSTRPLAPKAAKEAAKAEARAAKIAEAAGDPVALPALVDRAGNVRSLTLAEANDAIGRAATSWGALTVDVEHTGYPVGHADHALRTIQLGSPAEAVVLDAADPVQADLARMWLAEAPKLHAHSATADLVPLAHAELIDAESAWDRMHDTVIPALLSDPQSTGSDASGLKDLARDVLGEQATAPAADEARKALFKAGKWLTNTKTDTPVERSGWAQVSPQWSTMVRYAASDVLDTAALPHVLPKADPAVVERERTVQRMTARVAHHGLRIDGDRVLLLLADHNAARARAAAQVRLYGIDNPGSGQQVAAKLVELGAALPRTQPSSRHPEGQPSVAEGVLDPMKGTPGAVGALVRAVLDYRHHDTAIGTFLEPYRELAQRGDGRARPTVYTLGADTGRMSCVRPNLQQVPRVGGFRACITADPGSVLISADFAGVELRVAAALSGDTNLRQMLTEGVDVHWQIARQVFGPEATKGDRYAAKRIVFGRLYGGGVPTLARQAGVSESVAASAVDVLDAMTPGLSAWSREIRSAVKSGRTQFPTYSGALLHLPAAYPHKAPNYCIQRTARELLVDALLLWDDTRWGGGVVLPVHDEIVAVVPEADGDDATAALVAVMETELFGVQIKAEASAPAFAWADSA